MKLTSVVIGALVVCNVALLYQNFRLKASLERVRRSRLNPLGEERSPSFSLPSINGEMIQFNPSDAPFTLLFFFSPTDCAPCLDDALILQKLYREQGDALRVIGIASFTNRKEVIEFARGRIEFPLVIDEEGRVTQSLFKIERTPRKLLVNQKGEVVYASGPTHDALAREKFFQSIRQIVNNQ
jgi:peroxiredoxin